MSDFTLWFTEGIWHIADIKAYDHILFLVVLFGCFELKHWKKVLLLITAFTLGHSITLALSVLEVVKIKTSLVEFLIPCTILATAIYNLKNVKEGLKRNFTIHFLMALFFGLIHGLGFSILLRSMLGRAQQIVAPLFFFNIGIELGQLLVIGIILGISFIMVKIVKVPGSTWQFFLSSAAFGVAFIMALERL